jgi:hypothetical protein
LRHAYGIKLAEEGCPMHYISEVMGHHSIDFTRKHYARFSPESASRAVLRVLEGSKITRRQVGGIGFLVKRPDNCNSFSIYGTPGAIRTRDLRFRRPTL